MARQRSIFCLTEGTVPDEADELTFTYNPERLGRTVQVTFPGGTISVPPRKLAELGVLCLALAGTSEADDHAFDTLKDFELPAPFFMHLELLAARIARRMVQSLIDTYPTIRREYADERKREEFQAAVARQITTVMRDNA